MKLEFLNASVCVVAQEHNPTILHPAFLAAQGIVPEDWELVSPPICTPAFSVVQYINGIVFNIESNRFLVTDGKPSATLEESMASELALSYVEKMPHVRYTAIGINLQGFAICDSPETYLIERFLKAGPWNDTGRGMTALGLRFVYPVDDGLLRVGYDGGTLRRDEGEHKVILITGNFHTELPEDGRLDALRRALGRWVDRCRVFVESVNAILGLEE